MPNSNSRYCLIGIYWADHPDVPEFLAVEGKAVVFETADVARETLPTLAPGRVECWDKTREICAFSPLVRRGFNRLAIFTEYDPYDVPNGFRSKGIYSEAVSRDWRYHVLWSHVLPAILAWADKLESERLIELEGALELLEA